MLDVVVDLRVSLIEARGWRPPGDSTAVVGVPGVVGAERTRSASRAASRPRQRGRSAQALRERLGHARCTFENDVNLAAARRALGRASRQGVDDFAFLSIGTGIGAGLVLGGELHRGRHGAAGEIDLALAGLGTATSIPCAAALEAYADAGSAGASRARRAAARRPTMRAPCSPRRARATPLARQVVTEAARRIARNIVPIAAVADVSLVVLGGGIGANGDLLLAPMREHLARWLPYPPRVEVSSLGEAAVLHGRARAGGARALDNVFSRRRTP